MDVESILSIALSPTLPEDHLIWALTPSGKFTVKSAYRVALQDRIGHVSKESSNATCMKEFWRFIWCLQIPNKIRNFMWRACRNILPTKANLFHKWIAQDSTCEVCGNSEETTGHLLWHCHRARRCGMRWALRNIISWTAAQSFWICCGMPET
ncbi:hypothetical protein SO802_023362 [Lithocarpus litseifolius]|uniref:Reverse transcriptase zinc-binding domain-containing protein n=1 Tax=Lithocarpus litseifolius TaxID=425828 RepID=A0AAW2C972_9ROSI